MLQAAGTVPAQGQSWRGCRENNSEGKHEVKIVDVKRSR